MKETVWRMKRLTREMQTVWKRQDRVERETRRRMEREAEEQRKMDVEMMEVKRQQRKLNFLITQTELYAHFMQRKLAFNSSQSEELARILGQLDEGEKPARLAAIDDYDRNNQKCSQVFSNITKSKVSPGSQTCMIRFVPQFKVIPYWGNPQERRILRQFWAQKNVHTEDASFHVVITSYQLVVADIKYFNRVKWQYLVLDEAQAIKSSSSVRWKSLLGFQCRNRLLLSGTPVQNSMAELWALLHFIMPTLFDNHEEFAEWFSKDIESHAENKGSIDESRWHVFKIILVVIVASNLNKSNAI
ncbi:hypothetical protein B566_EDAN016150 [Ephemera danica]|nr:hypothetical protein B566_EDAN016150 [Ephemera danica]